MIHTVLIGACAGLMIITIATHLTGRISTRAHDGLLAIATGVASLSYLTSEVNPPAVVNAGLAAIYAHRWWNGGGGDSTRRRFRRWAQRFTGTRRTAPATA